MSPSINQMLLIFWLCVFDLLSPFSLPSLATLVGSILQGCKIEVCEPGWLIKPTRSKVARLGNPRWFSGGKLSGATFGYFDFRYKKVARASSAKPMVLLCRNKRQNNFTRVAWIPHNQNNNKKW